jgi:hypothetical protein
MFDSAMEKAKRLIEARAEVANLEGDLRDAAHFLSHEGARRATTEQEKAEIRRQSQTLQRALQGYL